MLNRAEWVKFFASFFNKEPEANRFFEGLTSRFDQVVADVTAAQLAGTTSPTVAFVAWKNYNGVYSGCSAGGFEISNAAYKQELIAKAGGTGFDMDTVTRWCSRNKHTSTGEYCDAIQCPNTTAIKEVSTLESSNPSCCRLPLTHALPPRTPAPPTRSPAHFLMMISHASPSNHHPRR